MKAVNILTIAAFMLALTQPADAETNPAAETHSADALSFTFPADTLQQKINRNTTRRNLRNAAHPVSDIGVNEPGVNLVHRESRFKAGAELADKVTRSAAAPGQKSFDVILKNGGASLAMFENQGYTFLKDNTLLLAEQLPLRLVVPDMTSRNGSGQWAIRTVKTGGRIIGAGTVSDIVKLKPTPIQTGFILLEAEKMIPGEYILEWQPAGHKAAGNRQNVGPGNFCFLYLPADVSNMNIPGTEQPDRLCAASDSVPAEKGINIEVVPAASYSLLPGNMAR